jgi:hypothetical protein
MKELEIEDKLIEYQDKLRETICIPGMSNTDSFLKFELLFKFFFLIKRKEKI